jgi:hypothetical protein
MPTTTSPLDALAAAIGGTPGKRDEIPVVNVPGGFIYVGMSGPGKPAPVRLDRLGKSVVDLGYDRHDVDALAEAYRAVTA